ncbi:MAG: hypothetical protein VX546_14480 [Myxococcota bacterium]|nr:hypothetical protein [Myxococcota bacterium]
MRGRTTSGVLGLVCALGTWPMTALGGTFLFTEEGFEDTIMHPVGYDGTGGVLEVTVCIVPGSADAEAMVVPIGNVVRTVSALVPTTANLQLGAENNVPPDRVDFESVALHELLHCVGLAHPNLGVAPDVDDPGFCSSHEGDDGEWDFDAGDDGVSGSGDDRRGDDVNLGWFQVANNDPFSIAPVVDRSTYSRDLDDLPNDDSFAAIASRTVAAVSAVAPGTESVMYQGTYLDEAQRTLGHDDVAMLRLAMAGHDEVAGTADDYALSLRFGGISAAGCDIRVDMDGSKTGFAACQAGAVFPLATHGSITNAVVYFHPEAAWFFNDVSNATGNPVVPAFSMGGLAALALGLLGIAVRVARRRA